MILSFRRKPQTEALNFNTASKLKSSKRPLNVDCDIMNQALPFL
jgi:hypothetical protein